MGRRTDHDGKVADALGCDGHTGTLVTLPSCQPRPPDDLERRTTAQDCAHLVLLALLATSELGDAQRVDGGEWLCGETCNERRIGHRSAGARTELVKQRRALCCNFLEQPAKGVDHAAHGRSDALDLRGSEMTPVGEAEGEEPEREADRHRRASRQSSRSEGPTAAASICAPVAFVP
jgi:hypothetical protein